MSAKKLPLHLIALITLEAVPGEAEAEQQVPPGTCETAGA
jgi:hypothetical protein